MDKEKYALSSTQNHWCSPLTLIKWVMVWFCFRDESVGMSYPGFNDGGTTKGSGRSTGAGSSDDGGDFFGMIFGSGAPPPPLSAAAFFLSFLISVVFLITTNSGAPFSLPLLLLLWYIIIITEIESKAKFICLGEFIAYIITSACNIL